MSPFSNLIQFQNYYTWNDLILLFKAFTNHLRFCKQKNASIILILGKRARSSSIWTVICSNLRARIVSRARLPSELLQKLHVKGRDCNNSGQTDRERGPSEHMLHRPPVGHFEQKTPSAPNQVFLVHVRKVHRCDRTTHLFRRIQVPKKVIKNWKNGIPQFKFFS